MGPAEERIPEQQLLLQQVWLGEERLLAQGEEHFVVPRAEVAERSRAGAERSTEEAGQLRAAGERWPAR